MKVEQQKIEPLPEPPAPVVPGYYLLEYDPVDGSALFVRNWQESLHEKRIDTPESIQARAAWALNVSLMVAGAATIALLAYLFERRFFLVVTLALLAYLFLASLFGGLALVANYDPEQATFQGPEPEKVSGHYTIDEEVIREKTEAYKAKMERIEEIRKARIDAHLARAGVIRPGGADLEINE